nr:MAG: hypothetical protein DIU64_06115 [Caldicoprobacter oshimai]
MPEFNLKKAWLFQPGFFCFCAPGMGVNSVVKVNCRQGSTSLLAKGKGVHREVESEGSRRQNHGSMNKNPIRG